MGTFTGHLAPGLAFTLLGLWHTLNTVVSYKLRGPSGGFAGRTWYPAFSSFSHLPLVKCLELLLLLAFSAVAISTQLLEFPLLGLSYTPDGLEHAAMFLHLAVYASAALVAELSGCPPAGALRGLVGVLAANVFAQELFLLHFHSADHAGVEGHYHWLLQVIVAVSLLSAVVAVPGSFPAALVRSMSVTFQGVWLTVMAFALWVPRLVPEGCYPTSAGAGSEGGVSGAITCGTAEADARARMLGNLQFSWALAGVSIFTAGLCQKHGGGDGMEYRQLVAAGVDVQLSSGREDELKRAGAYCSRVPQKEEAK